jgi:hypothetical protein|tara:strand:- start:10124 stop:10342 length:219 start_codon:yes stop_codon:yes gene_type:complete
MEFEDYLRDPAWAGIVAGGITAGYIHAKSRLNNEGKLPMSSYTKPAMLVAILVFFIISQGVSKRETISSDPF